MSEETPLTEEQLLLFLNLQEKQGPPIVYEAQTYLMAFLMKLQGFSSRDLEESSHRKLGSHAKIAYTMRAGKDLFQGIAPIMILVLEELQRQKRMNEFFPNWGELMFELKVGLKGQEKDSPGNPV